MNHNINNNNIHHNESVEHEPKIDNKFSLFSGTQDPLPGVNVSLFGGKEQRTVMISGLTCLWGSGATNRVIDRKHNKNYELKMWSKTYNKVQ